MCIGSWKTLFYSFTFVKLLDLGIKRTGYREALMT